MKLPEYDIYQNKVLGAHLIWEFTKAYKEHSNSNSYPSIYHIIPVLPLCLNRRVVEGIKSRNFREGSLARAIEENKDIFSGLQERMIDMMPTTFESIYLGVKGGLMTLDKTEMQILPNFKNPPEKILKNLQEDYKDMLSSAKRLGSWFAQLNFQEITMYFNINI